MIRLKIAAVLLLASYSACNPLIYNEEVEAELILKEFREKYLLDQNRADSHQKARGSLQELQRQKHPDQGLTVVELITKYGYPVEVFEDVETEDGYLLTVHRIPHGKNNSELVNRPAVFVMHGLLCSSADWIAMGPDKGLAYILADKGFDVFLGNARGNTWSRKHKKYDPDKDKKAFWDFCWHDIGYYDIPAMIDLVITETGQEQIYYIGHSQGTTAFFVMASEKPEYNAKIKLMSALSPVVFMGHAPNLFIKLLAHLEGLASILGNLIGFYEFLPSNKLMQNIGQSLCNDDAIFQEICANVFFLIAGYNSDQLNRTMLPVILSNVPAGAATKQFYHYAQEIKTGDFKQFDYGFFGNLARYKQTSPPKYDLSKVTAEVALFYSDNDNLADETDVKKLYHTLENVVLMKKIRNFSHLDFLWAIDVPTLLYDTVISLMERQEFATN